MRKKISEASGLKKMDNFQKTIMELEKFQERLDDIDNIISPLDLQSYLGHINYAIISLYEQMSIRFGSIVERLFAKRCKEDSEKKSKETEIYHI